MHFFVKQLGMSQPIKKIVTIAIHYNIIKNFQFKTYWYGNIYIILQH